MKMRLGLCSIAAAMLVWDAAPAASEPAKDQTAASPAAPRKAAPVVLASADSVVSRPPTQAEKSSASPKPVIARKTSCRCGDSDSEAVADDQY